MPVFDDADVEALVGCLAEDAYYNTGQDCTAPCRVVAGPGVYDRLLGDLGDAVGGLDVGDPTLEDTAVGPLVSAAQRERVAGMVSRAVEAGAELVAGGEVIDGPASSTRRRWSRTRGRTPRWCSARCSARW